MAASELERSGQRRLISTGSRVTPSPTAGRRSYTECLPRPRRRIWCIGCSTSPPENFRREALRLFAGGLKGLNVTLPHKQAAAELVNELTPRAERAQRRQHHRFFRADTSLLGDNTDGLGLMADLENNLGLALTDKRVLILGAGGAVRGVLGPLMERELREVVIANRTPERARKLAAEFADMGEISGCGFAEVEGPAVRSHHQRHVGEPAGRDAGNAGRDWWARKASATTWPMAAAHTPFTLWAKSLHAARTTKGWGMLVEQAAESFLLWRGIRPDTEPVLEALAQHA